jgi:hypothetical protein
MSQLLNRGAAPSPLLPGVGAGNLGGFRTTGGVNVPSPDAFSGPAVTNWIL